MKLLLAFLLVLSACTNVDSKNKVTDATERGVTHRLYKGDLIYTVEIDGHEYLVMRRGNRGGITHKANCKYCKEK